MWVALLGGAAGEAVDRRLYELGGLVELGLDLLELGLCARVGGNLLDRRPELRRVFGNPLRLRS